MSYTPFRDTAQKLARSKDFVTMQVESGSARSHGWWRNVVMYGAWNGPSNSRVGPPDPDAIRGIAKLFDTTEDQVKKMVAADWYGVLPKTEISGRVLQLAPVLDELKPEDAELVDKIARRLRAAYLDGFADGITTPTEPKA